MAQPTVEITSTIDRTMMIVRSRLPVSKAFLFGSYLQGTAHADSDIDIAVFSPLVDTLTLKEKVELLVDIERQVDPSIELHLFGSESLRNARPTNFIGYLMEHGKPIQ